MPFRVNRIVSVRILLYSVAHKTASPGIYRPSNTPPHGER